MKRCAWCWRPLTGAWYEYAGTPFCDQRCAQRYLAAGDGTPPVAPDVEPVAGQLELEDGTA